jgi:1A family penicillin-binding protein
MSSSDPSHSRTLLSSFTQAVKTIQAKVASSELPLKRNARVPKLRVDDGQSKQPQDYVLLDDRYILGRSSRSSDIVIRNPIVSHVHATIKRHPKHRHQYLIQDQNSTNGIFHRKRRVQSQILRHRDEFTLGPAELEAAVKVQYIDPPPWYIRTLRYGLYGVAGITALVVGAIAWEWPKVAVNPLPTENQGPVVIFSRDQVPLAGRPDTVHGELKQLSDFSPALIDALLASEDSRYYWHVGVDPIGVLRAIVANVRGGGIQEGASTLTQQLARSLFRSYVGTEDSMGRKLREAVVALKLETEYSKDFILLTYLNKVYLGVNANGFEDAARFYFGKSAQSVNVAEAATLVGILPAPNSFNPVQDYQAAIEYRNRVIARMASQGRISQAEATRARRSRIEISPAARTELQSTRAPYYYNYVFDELEELLGTELAREGNFFVETGLDLKVQQQAESALRQAINTTGARSGFNQGALITLDFQTGEILALVGGVDYNQSQLNRATQAQRQPGSTFKLFGYLAAIDAGISPGTTYSCAPTTIGGQTYAGCRTGTGQRLNMYDGLAQSENVVAIQVAQDIGMDNVINMARRLGIRSQLAAVPALVLGQSEVTMLELSRAYAAVANGGRVLTPRAITRVLDAGDCQNPQDIKTCRVIYPLQTPEEATEALLDPEVAMLMTQMLTQVVRSGTGRAAAIGLDVAGKTGTTNDNRDLWFVGYIPSRKLLTAVWLGNDDNSPTAGSSAQAAALWRDYMRQVVSLK